MYEPAPLVDTPEAPVPSGATPEWYVGAAGAKLRAALFTPPGPPRGSVVLSGGRTEPIEKYFETIDDFLERGFVVLAHDWRGQGLSARPLADRLKGHAKGYKPFLEDFRRLLDVFDDRLPRPWVAVGHSMGGCLTLLALAHGEKRFVSAVLSAPMLGLKFGKYSVATAGAMVGFTLAVGAGGRYMLGQPGAPFDETFEANTLTHDPARFERHRAQIRAQPDLALGAPTWGWLDFALKAMAYLAKPERLRAVTIPVEIVSAGEDNIVDNAAQAAAARNLPQGRLITVPGAYHEILMETDDMRNIFLRVFDTLTGKTAPKPAEAPKPSPPPEAPKPAPVVAEAPRPAPAPAPSPTPAPVQTKAPAAEKPTAAPKPAAAPRRAMVAAKKVPAPKAAPPKSAAQATKPAPKPVVAAKPAAKAKPPVAKPAVAKPAVAKPPVAKAAVAKAAPAKAAPVKATTPKTAASAKPAAAKAAAKPANPKVAAKAVATKAPTKT